MIAAFQGEHGAYSEVACRKFFGEKVETLPSKALKDVFAAVEDEAAEFGVVPVENSRTGDVYETYDLLLEFSLNVHGEVFLRVEHSLISQKGAKIANIRRVYSHSQALAQCSDFLDIINAEKIAVYDTAGAVAMVKKTGSKEEAAIASEFAAALYGMEVLKKGIQTDKDNVTRFFIIGRERSDLATPAAVNTGMKTSIAFTTQHKSGALYKCLGGFAHSNINLTKLVSRPIKGRSWEYLFYLDFIGGVKDENVKQALDELKSHAQFVRILGSYSSANGA